MRKESYDPIVYVATVVCRDNRDPTLQVGKQPAKSIVRMNNIGLEFANDLLETMQMA